MFYAPLDPQELIDQFGDVRFHDLDNLAELFECPQCGYAVRIFDRAIHIPSNEELRRIQAKSDLGTVGPLRALLYLLVAVVVLLTAVILVLGIIIPGIPDLLTLAIKLYTFIVGAVGAPQSFMFGSGLQ
jgi:hypothetical protein